MEPKETFKSYVKMAIAITFCETGKISNLEWTNKGTRNTINLKLELDELYSYPFKEGTTTEKARYLVFQEFVRYRKILLVSWFIELGYVVTLTDAKLHNYETFTCTININVI